MVIVRGAVPDDWKTLRDVRLAALRDAPYAFGSTYGLEATLAEEQWRDRLARSATFFAFDGLAWWREPPAGVVGVYEQDSMAELTCMWVRPTVRGRGVGEALVEAGADWAKAHDHPSLFLWIIEPNSAARKLYDRCGFMPTGQRQPLPSNPSMTEMRMQLAL
jgi:GNAT superfamily N-acetyltransferase